MSTKKIAIASAVGAFAVMALIFAYPAMASSASTQGNVNYQQLLQRSEYSAPQAFRLSAGQTITLSSVAGGYWAVGDHAANGTASASMTVEVSGALSGGYVLTVTGGTLNLNGTTYTISNGSAELGRYGVYMVGQGQAGSAQFLFLGKDLGQFGSTNYGILRVDLKDGSSEFAARLLVTVAT